MRQTQCYRGFLEKLLFIQTVIKFSLIFISEVHRHVYKALRLAPVVKPVHLYTYFSKDLFLY